LNVNVVAGMRCPTCAGDPTANQVATAVATVSLKCEKCGKVALLKDWLVARLIAVVA